MIFPYVAHFSTLCTKQLIVGLELGAPLVLIWIQLPGPKGTGCSVFVAIRVGLAEDPWDKKTLLSRRKLYASKFLWCFFHMFAVACCSVPRVWCSSPLRLSILIQEGKIAASAFFWVVCRSFCVNIDAWMNQYKQINM